MLLAPTTILLMAHPDLRPVLTGLALSFLLASANASLLAQQEPATGRTVVARQPGELGKVSWWRDEQVAQQQAKASGKPVLVLFQEVPG